MRQYSHLDDVVADIGSVCGRHDEQQPHRRNVVPVKKHSEIEQAQVLRALGVAFHTCKLHTEEPQTRKQTEGMRREGGRKGEREGGRVGCGVGAGCKERAGLEGRNTRDEDGQVLFYEGD